MSKFDVKEVQTSVKTVSEFEALLGSYKTKNPAKFAAKLANGEFDKFRSQLIDDTSKAEKVEKPKEPKVKS